jgi:RNA polymerase sigma-70 factor (ECF subfamily)
MIATKSQGTGFDSYMTDTADDAEEGVEPDELTPDPGHLEDIALIVQARTDPEAFGALYLRYVDRIYTYIYYRTRNVEEAEDLTARTFQRAMQHIPTWEDQGVPFAAWLYRIARNLVLNWHRDTGKRPLVALDDIVQWHVGDESPEKTVQGNERENALLEAVAQLPEDRQQLIILKFLHQLSNAEIGAILGRSEGAVKSLYHRTLLALREILEPSEAQGAEILSERESASGRWWPFGRRTGQE